MEGGREGGRAARTREIGDKSKRRLIGRKGYVCRCVVRERRGTGREGRAHCMMFECSSSYKTGEMCHRTKETKAKEWGL